MEEILKDYFTKEGHKDIQIVTFSKWGDEWSAVLRSNYTAHHPAPYFLKASWVNQFIQNEKIGML